MMLAEFDEQTSRLVSTGYPELFDLDEAEFVSTLAPLRDRLPARGSVDDDGNAGQLPFVLVVATERVTVEAMLANVSRRGLPAIERLYPRTPADFQPIDSVALPDGEAYLLTDLDRGADTLNVAPNDAFDMIAARGRTPLTIAEGIAVLTHFPEFLQPNNCFSLLASRAGDKRVPAFWLSEKRPKLGWCWAGNPHTWLGSASAAERRGAGVSFG